MPGRFSVPNTLRFIAFAFALLAPVGRQLVAQQPATRTMDDMRWRDECRSRFGNRPRSCVVGEQGMRPTGALTVEPGRNGAVTVIGWNRDSVLVRTRVQAQGRSESAARALAERVAIRADRGRVRAEGPATSDEAEWVVAFEIYVPTHTELAIATENGPVEVDGVQGRMRLSAVNGPISLAGVGGDVVARAQNGPLTVELAGTRWAGKGLDAETENGPIDLYIPRDYSARLQTGTSTGPFDIDVPLAATIGRHADHHADRDAARSNDEDADESDAAAGDDEDDGGAPRRIVATLGAGGPTVRVVTTNGPVSIHR